MLVYKENGKAAGGGGCEVKWAEDGYVAKAERGKMDRKLKERKMMVAVVCYGPFFFFGFCFVVCTVAHFYHSIIPLSASFPLLSSQTPTIPSPFLLSLISIIQYHNHLLSISSHSISIKPPSRRPLHHPTRGGCDGRPVHPQSPHRSPLHWRAAAGESAAAMDRLARSAAAGRGHRCCEGCGWWWLGEGGGEVCWCVCLYVCECVCVCVFFCMCVLVCVSSCEMKGVLWYVSTV
jgi:hypothetical protein